jgi:serine/threonine-protein kinase RsbW
VGQEETIRAILPGRLEYRDLAIRMVVSACKLVRGGGEDFGNQVVSAFSEALNNVILHGSPATTGDVQIEIELGDDRMTIRLKDFGRPFDPRTVPAPDLEALPESGLGAFIIRSFMDEVSYESGRPNTLTMTKLASRGVSK